MGGENTPERHLRACPRWEEGVNVSGKSVGSRQGQGNDGAQEVDMFMW